MFGSILNRTIFWELVRVFLLALTGLTGLFLIAGLIQQASQLGLSPMQVLSAIPLFVPSTLPYTIPATTLFASCVVYGRLAHDNEVVAIKGAGVHLFSVLKPALALGVLTTAVTAGLYHTVIPITQQMLQRQILEDPEEVLYNTLRRERCFRHPNFPYAMYVKDVQGRRLIDVVLKRKGKGRDPRTGAELVERYDFVARAREARLRVDLAEGVLYIDPDRFVFYDDKTRGTSVSSSPFPVPLPENLTGKDIKTRAVSLTWDELGEREGELRHELADLELRRDESIRLGAEAAEPNAKALYHVQEHQLRVRAEVTARLLHNIEAEFWMRPALAAGCLVFALIGCPVGLWANRADYLSTFVVCFLPTVFVYYPLLLAGSNMGKDGRLPMGLGCWLANIAMATAGVALSWRLLRR